MGCAYLDGGRTSLTPIEYKLLSLLSKKWKGFDLTFITQKIWGKSWDNDVASRVFMQHSEENREKQPNAPQYIQTHIGVGYRMLKVEQRRLAYLLLYQIL